MIKSTSVHQIDITADQLVSALLALSESETVCVLDSCGVGHLGSHLLVAGLAPVETVEMSDTDPARTLAYLDQKLSGGLAAIFTLSYGLGAKLLNIKQRSKATGAVEPDVFLASFDVLIAHDYTTSTTTLNGDPGRFAEVERKLIDAGNIKGPDVAAGASRVTSNFTKREYLYAVETIKERIRCGDTYQTNLTQQLTAQLPRGPTPEAIFDRLRQAHPAAFAALIRRRDSTVISISPERFFWLDGDRRTISTSPIKGTRRRGSTAGEDARLRSDLLSSEKDRAENTMIVDLLRNDLGRICDYGTVRVERLCDLEEHPTFFHLVSTIAGELSPGAVFSDILRAVFPCGSITGAPKISTMRIIDEIEPTNRGLSMGAIGYYIPAAASGTPGQEWNIAPGTDLSVAIRTMVIRDGTATFNVGGGIVIDSDAEDEYAESLTKASALLTAINGRLE